MKKKWKEIMFILEQKFTKNPIDVAYAIESMYSKFKSLKTDSSLFSAMCNFGKI